MDKKMKACLFVDRYGGTDSENRADAGVAYAAMVEWLHLYVAGCSVLTGIRPFQLSYRPFNIYLVDIGGCPLPLQILLMGEVGDIVRSRPSRLYLFWTGECWEAFQTANPDLRDNPHCINCCEIGVFEKIEEILLDMVE